MWELVHKEGWALKNWCFQTVVLEKTPVRARSLQSCLPLCNPMDYSTPGFLVLHQLLELAQTDVHWVSDAPNHFILCCPLLLLPLIFPSIRVFSNESALHIRRPKYWSFSFSISPSNEYLGLISFRMDWFDLLAIQGTPRSLLQHHSSKSSILWPSALFISPTFTSIHDYRKNHSFEYRDLCRQTDVSIF